MFLKGPAGGKRPDSDDISEELETRLVSEARSKTVGFHTAPVMPKLKRVSLLVMDGPMKGKSIPLEKPQVLIGRNQGDIPLDDAKVSRKHCVLEVHGQTALLVDLDSANGTFVDGKRIASCQLSHLSEFRVGGTTLMLTFT
ncbi:MAG TPA: FHA domain-containing protein [Terriglobia bacterium]|nr:FHA domain-containing protein [Terriglobia bacterium]